MATYPTDPNPPIKPIILGLPIDDRGKLSAADISVSPEIAQVLQDWAAKNQRRLELLMLVARLRELLGQKEKIEMAAAPLKPDRTPQYLQLHGQIAQVAKKLAQAGVYASPNQAIRDIEVRLSRPFPIERFHGQPVVGLYPTQGQYPMYTPALGVIDPEIMVKVERALENTGAARRPQRPARNQK
jgi:hypothetical protein